MKHKVLLKALSVEGADRRVVAHLLREEPEAQVLPGEQRGAFRYFRYFTFNRDAV